LITTADPQGRFSLQGRTIVITGGTRGIGRAIAEGTAALGAKVVVASRKVAACIETVDAIEALGGIALGVPTHLGEPESLRALVDATVDRFGGIDVVVNNAANALSLPLGQFTESAWSKVFDVNLRGPVFLVQEALPHLEASDHAVVINMVAAGAFVFAENTSMYSAAKAGLVSFTRSMAAAYADRGIRVNALAPGAVDTDMLRNNPPDVQRRIAEQSLQGRLAKPEEMVGPVVFLASEASSFMTGQVLLVDGGWVPH
jgi:NAD(P)-dependent dehydrogenase (short-subunit alcohol dehydrogenase family)